MKKSYILVAGMVLLCALLLHRETDVMVRGALSIFQQTSLGNWFTYAVYEVLAIVLPKAEFMNWGYYFVEQPEYKNFAPANFPKFNLFAANLYYFVALNKLTKTDYENAVALEIGSGRGAGANFLTKQLDVQKYISVDYGKRNTEFCRARNQDQSTVECVQGDATNFSLQSLGLSQPVDFILNVESSHCYLDFNAFLENAFQVLRPGGFLLFTDFRDDRAGHEDLTLEEVMNLVEADIANAGFMIKDKQDISESVVKSRDVLDQFRHPDDDTSKTFMSRFLQSVGASKDSVMYKKFKSDKAKYIYLMAQKPLSNYTI